MSDRTLEALKEELAANKLAIKFNEEQIKFNEEQLILLRKECQDRRNALWAIALGLILLTASLALFYMTGGWRLLLAVVFLGLSRGILKATFEFIEKINKESNKRKEKEKIHRQKMAKQNPQTYKEVGKSHE